MKRSNFSILLVFMLLFQLLAAPLAVLADAVSGAEGDDGASVTDAVYQGEDDVQPGGGSGGSGSSGPPDDTVGDAVYGAPLPMLFKLGMGAASSTPVAYHSVSATANETTVKLSGGYQYGDIVLGDKRTIDVTLTNHSDAYMFNVGLELVLGDGLQIAESMSPAPASTEADEYGVQTVYWKDIKNLQAGEEFVFPVTIESADTYRAQDGVLVEFGARVPLTANIYHSSDARTVAGPPAANAKVSVAMDDSDPGQDNRWRIVPFTIMPSPAHDYVKGAGEDETGTSEWGQFGFYFDIVNNARYATNFTNLSNVTDGSVQIYSLSHGGTVGQNIAANARTFEWSNLTVAAGSTTRLTLNGAFLDKTMLYNAEEEDPPANGNNQGDQITDGFLPGSSMTYAAEIAGGGSYGIGGFGSFDYDLAIAKDIVIDKSVTASTADVGYGTRLDYTLAIKTNEYYPVSDVVVEDTIGDGQTLVAGSVAAPADFVLETQRANGDGTTTLIWKLAGPGLELAQKQDRTFSYSTMVDANWKQQYGGGPVVAGDVIVNNVTVDGNTTVSGAVSDVDRTELEIPLPDVREHIYQRNAEDVGPSERTRAYATVGDTLTFVIEYDAVGLNAKQNTVEIRDYLPLGTVPSVLKDIAVLAPQYDLGPSTAYGPLYPIEYTSNGSTLISYPTYYSADNLLIWEFASIDENQTDMLTTEVEVYVLNNTDHVAKDKGDQNLVNMSVRNSSGTIKSERSTVQIDYAEPEVKITRQVARSNAGVPGTWQSSIDVNGSELVFVKLELESNGHTPAYNVVLNEHLAADLTNPELHSDPAALAEGSFAIVGSNLVFTLVNPIEHGESISLIYKATVEPTIGSGQIIKQSADAAYDSQPVPASGRQYAAVESGTESGPVTRMEVPPATLKYELVQHGSGTERYTAPTNKDKVRVGDWVVYKVAVDLPTGDYAYDSVLTAALHANQTLLGVYGSYNTADGSTGTELVAGSGNQYEYNSTTGTITFLDAALPEVAGAAGDDYVFYIKTQVEAIGSGTSEPQSSSAGFYWYHENGTELEANKHTADPATAAITVTVPELTAGWYYSDNDGGAAYDNADPKLLSSGEHIDLVFKITNEGANTAYAFTPVIEVPEGYKITAPGPHDPEVTSLVDDRIVTYAQVTSLAAGQSLSYPITVEMDSVPGSGAVYDVEGRTGDYYSSPYAYAEADDNHPRMFASVEAEAILGVPLVDIRNEIIATTNDSNLTWVRPGDVITYELQTIVGAGTQALDLVLEDTIANHEKFEYFANSVVIKQDDSDITQSIKDANGITYSDGKLTIHLGTTPPSSPAHVVYTVTFELRAKQDGTSPTGGTAGSFNALTQAFGTSATARWYTAEGQLPANASPPIEAATTEIQVRQPQIAFEANAAAYSFTDETAQQITYTFANSGNSAAVIRNFEVEVPEGFEVEHILNGGTFDEAANKISWVFGGTDLFIVDANNGTRTLTFELKKTAAIGAAQPDLELIGKLDHYYSTNAVFTEPVEETGLASKRYVLNPAVKESAVTIAPVTLTAALIANSNEDTDSPVTVRQGDVLIYELDINIPGVSPAYNVVLADSGLIGQAIIGVEIDDGKKELVDDVGYPLADDITADTKFRVITRVTTDGALTGQVSYTPSITYNSVSGDNQTNQSAGAAMLQQTIVAPELAVTVDANPNPLTTSGQTGDVTIEVENTGDSTAYSSQVTITIEHGGLFEYKDDDAAGDFHNFKDFTTDSLDGISGTLAVDAVNSTYGKLVLIWSIDAIAADAKASIIFNIRAKNDTALGAMITFTAVVDEYQTIPNADTFDTVLDSITVLGPETAADYLSRLVIVRTDYYDSYRFAPADVRDFDTVALAGSFTLTEAALPQGNLVSRFAGQGTVVFEHTLTNTGAGQDTYTLSVDGLGGAAFPAELDAQVAAELLVGGKVVLTGTWIDNTDKLQWACANDVDASQCGVNGETYIFSLPATGIADIALQVYVSERISYKTAPNLVYKLTAQAEAAGDENPQSVTDTVHITSVPLDGWSGIEDKADWQLPEATYRHSESLVLYAETANHIDKVEFDVVGTAIQAEAMTLHNPASYLTDGKKLWKYEGHVDQLNDLAAGVYNVTFRSYVTSTEAAAEETDAFAAVAPGLNNRIAVIVPELSIAIQTDDDKTILATEADFRTVTVSVENNGDSVAYNAEVELEVTAPDSFIYGAMNGTIAWTAEDGYTWMIPSIAAGATETLTFTVKSNVAAVVGTAVTVNGDLVKYDSLPAGGVEYTNPETPSVTITIEGSHTLVDDQSVSVTAGKPAVFEHTLKNTGAGRDTYLIQLDDGGVKYPGTLYIGGFEVATAAWNVSAWEWTFEDGAVSYNIGGNGVPGIALDADASTAVRFDVHVPETAAYGLTVYTYSLTAEAMGSGYADQSVTDSLTITGTDLDGWTGDQSYTALFGDDPVAWSQPQYLHGEPVQLNAVSAVHVSGVQASYYEEAGSPAWIPLTLVNAGSYIADGYKLWSVTHMIPGGLPRSEKYFVTFQSLQGTSDLETDHADQADPIALNNFFTIQESAVTLTLEADKPSLSQPGEAVAFTATVKNPTADNASSAYDAVEQIVLPENFDLDEIVALTVNGVGKVLADEDGFKITTSTDAAGIVTITLAIEEIKVDEEWQLVFTAKPQAGIATTANTTTGATLVYTSLPSGGKSYGPLNDTVDVLINGSHTLAADQSQSTTAGKSVTFDHSLTNTGAGRDQLLLSLDGLYPTELYADNVLIASGHETGGQWVWDSINPAYAVDILGVSTPVVQLDAGQAAALKLIVHVPVTTHYDVATDTALTATSVLGNNTANVTDEITIAGTDLDGWISNQLWSQWSKDDYRSDWSEATYNPTSAVKLSAITSVDATQVKAELYKLDASGIQTGAAITADPIMLTLYNADTFLTDGYKLWQYVTYTLAATTEAGRYFAEFEASYAGASDDADNSITTVPSEAGYNNYFTVKDKIDLIGTVTDRKDHTVIEGATVILKELNGSVRDTATTDSSGNYRFDNIPIKHYELVVEHPLYADYDRTISTLPEHPADSFVRRDAELVDFVIALAADPSVIVGDGIETSVLTVTLTDKDGNPKAGVKVTLTAEIGTLIGGAAPGEIQVTTDSAGKAYVTYQSAKIEGAVAQEIPVLATVNDPDRELYAEDVIYVIFAPGAIRGTVIDQATGLPIANATVHVYADFDQDGIADFSITRMTDADGKYKIAIPKGELPYTVEIAKPVDMNGTSVDITFAQKSYPELVDMAHYVEYPSENTATGLILQKNEAGTTTYFDATAYSQIKIEQIAWNAATGKYEVVPGGHTGTVDANGIYSITNLPKDPNAALKFRVIREAPETPGSASTIEIAMGTLDVTVSEDGDVIIGVTLIDPYGDVRNKNTLALIPDAQVTLYYWSDPGDANWNRPGNEANWVKVDLPELPNFPPFDNLSPTQTTGPEGLYAWMVYPETDYFIVSKARGYQDYISERIRVDWDIVEHNIRMTPIPTGGGGGFFFLPPVIEEAEKDNTGIEIDLAVDISVNQRGYMEHSPIELTVDYLNRSAVVASDVIITLDLPSHTTPIDLDGGILSEDGTQIIWTMEQLGGHEQGKRIVELQAGKINGQQQELSSRAEIVSRDHLIRLSDDVSKLKMMLFSNNYGEFKHQRYIVGYPDGEFKPEKNITRAEIANIFARILQLRGYVESETLYADVPQGKWYTDGIEAATKRGLFSGYNDGTFRPDQPITRAELAIVIGKFLELEDRPPVVIGFKDLTGHWAANIIENVRRNRVAQGYTDGSFKPNSYLVRSEAVTMINRMLYRGPLHGADPSYLDVTAQEWMHGDVEESTRSHEASRNADGSEQFIREIETTLGF